MSGQPSGPDPWLGQTIDTRYRIERLLGAGGLGKVYRATHLGIDRPVALKVLLPDLLPSAALRQRFEREVKTLSRLSHPHIVTLTDSGVIDDHVGYLVMELLEGESLEQRLRANGTIPPDQAIAITRQILLAVAEAHSKHVLHRDIKPGNIFLQPLADGGLHVKLLDFGLAKVRNELASDPGAYPTLTADGTIVGTPTYMAPEQAAAATVDPSSDCYSIGIVLFEMLAGRPPFDGASKLEIIRHHLGTPVPDLADVRPAMRPTPELRALIVKALAKDRADRFTTARDMLSALDALPTPVATFAPGAEPHRSPAISGTEPTMSLRSSEVKTVDSVPKAPPLPPKIQTAPKKTMSKRNATALIIGLAIFALGAICVTVWAISPDENETVDAEDTGDEPVVGPVTDPALATDPEAPVEEDAIIEEPEEDPANPFNAPLPSELREARRRISRGRRLTDDQIRDVTRYQRQHGDDARPSLLLARHHRFGGDHRLAVRHYRAAHRIDPRVTGFPPMLPDLLRAATERESTSAASQAIAQIYGRDALPEIERALDRRRLAAEDRRRLERLRARIAQ